MQPNPPPDPSPTAPELNPAASSSTPTRTPTRQSQIQRLEAIRTESGKVAAEIFNATRHLHNNPNDAHVTARLRLFRQLQTDLTDMTEAELLTHRPLIITGLELGPTDVPMLLQKAILDEKSQHEEAKRLAKTGHVATARVVARDIVRTRKLMARLYTLDAGNKYRTVKAFVEDVEARVARLSDVEALGSTVRLGEEPFADVVRFGSQLASDLMLLDRYEVAVRALLKKLAVEQQLEAGRPLARGLLEIRSCRDAVSRGVRSLIEKATDDCLKAAIRYMHSLPAEGGE